PAGEAQRRGGTLAERAERVEDVRVALARPDREDGGDGQEPGRDEQRPERYDAEDGARGDEAREHDRSRGRDGDERASGRPHLVLAGDEPGEEREPDGVARARGDERVDERAGAVPGGGVGEARAAAAEADGRAPAPGRADEGEGE